MTWSRRAFLVGASTATAAMCCPAVAFARPTVNVRDFGAAGDGVADDSAAILAAVNTLTPGSTLYFPGGRYRFARPDPPGGAAIAITGLNDIEVQFELGAELLMDNVDGATSTGTTHGVVIRGPASNVSLRDVTIRWTRPVKRSIGDGIRIVGYPTGESAAPSGWNGPSAPVRGVRLTGCQIYSCPQAGVIMMGVSDIEVTGLRVQESRGDGLHFNACQRARVDRLEAIDTGDDGLALVTYHTDDFAFDGAAETFSFPTLTEWSNAQFTVTNVTVQGGQANGVRIAGANGADIRNLGVTGALTGAGVMIDSASPGSDTEWRYVASQGVFLDAIAVQDCEFGIHVLARPDGAGDRRFADFGIRVANATLRECSNWAVRAESLTELRMTGFRLDTCTAIASAGAGGNGGVGFGDADGVELGTVTVRHAQSVVSFQTHNSASFVADALYVEVGGSGATGDPQPCVSLDESSGILNDVATVWPDAPANWHPIRITNQGVGCGPNTGAPPVDIRVLHVTPSTVTEPITKC